jgi:predicted nucleic acid-binding protein
MITVSLDFAIAEQAATLRRTHRTKLADSIIAATALVIRAPLLTRNTRDFKRITELKIVDV